MVYRSQSRSQFEWPPPQGLFYAYNVSACIIIIPDFCVCEDEYQYEWNI